MAILLDWLEVLIRWGHILVGISWIGTSFYFNWFDLSVRPPEGRTIKDRARGTLHEVHGGSFYYHEQFLPDQDHPRTLAHSGPAQLTFATGIALLVLVYWFGASVYLIDPEVHDLSVATAILLSAAPILIVWLFYDRLCRKVTDDRVIFVVMAIVTVVLAWFFGQIFGARAAYLHVGVVLGSTMVANVQHAIVPNHIAMRKQLQAGEPLKTAFGDEAKRRSQHNNYITLPVIFSMISIHFPLAYSHQYAWLILSLIMGCGVAVRHYFNVTLAEERRDFRLIAAACACLTGAVALTFIPTPPAEQNLAELSDPVLKDIHEIVQRRCTTCHSARPSSEDFTTAPLGFKLDTLSQLRARADKVLQRSILTDDMPPNNITEMSDDERERLGAWLRSIGAKEVPEEN
ncbi:MAG: urate hydroxylase PuuD [Geminicoccaceae bacterium]